MQVYACNNMSGIEGEALYLFEILELVLDID